MAHSLEGRVPYLDWNHVQFALTIPPDLKIHGSDRIEKWPLRKTFSDMMPEILVWRKKQKFAEGTGSFDIIRKEAERQISDAEFEREAARAKVKLRTKEELYCYRLFRRHFDNDEAVACIGRTLVY